MTAEQLTPVQLVQLSGEVVSIWRGKQPLIEGRGSVPAAHVAIPAVVSRSRSVGRTVAPLWETMEMYDDD